MAYPGLGRAQHQGVDHSEQFAPLVPPSDRALGGALTDSASAAPPWHAPSKGGPRGPPMDGGSSPRPVSAVRCNRMARPGREGPAPNAGYPLRGYRQRGLPPSVSQGPWGGPCKTPPRCARWHAKSKGGSDEPPMDSAPFHIPCQPCGATARLDRDMSSPLMVEPFRYTLCNGTLNNNSRCYNGHIRPGPRCDRGSARPCGSDPASAGIRHGLCEAGAAWPTPGWAEPNTRG